MMRRPFLHALMLLALLPAAAFAADKPAAPLVEGTDYVVIDDGKPFAPAVKGKVEVVEIFGYTCPHCARFQPKVSAWKKKRAAQVNFVPMAAPFGSYWTPYAKAFYAAQTLGAMDKTHDAMFLALHTDGTLPIHNASADEIAAFYARYGVDTQKFLAAFDGPEVQQRMDNALAFIQRSGVDGTPTIVVAGKYRVTGMTFDETLRIADQLVARERASVAKR